MKQMSYSDGIRDAFVYLLNSDEKVFVLGQGLWSPWYVGNTMLDLDKIYGRERIIDTPVSECAVTGMAVGASIAGFKPIVVHPRMDFMLYAIDPIVNQAAKWNHMFNGKSNAPLTVRAIINRGGEQGAQHSQSLHSWFSHIPGLKVVMPSSPKDARDLLIASVLSPDPVMYIDDRWLYDEKEFVSDVELINLENVKPKIVRNGSDLTIAGAGYSVLQAKRVANILDEQGLSVEVIDIRLLNPFDSNVICESVLKTGRLVAIDGGWKNSGFASEIIASVLETIDFNAIKKRPLRITLPCSPAPCSGELESAYYKSDDEIVKIILDYMKG
jgi:pyruvate/2-oxoglutarate/acetoin dehydrogenase E1 component